MTLPNFLVIGAGRSGTTSLHEYLGQHPDVFVGEEKSPNFFVSHEPLPEWETATLRAMARQWVSAPEAYEAFFKEAGSKKAVGEVSPVYLQATSAPARIKATCPDAKIVAILREPVARAYSHFLGRRRDGLERRTDFAAVMREERSRPLPDTVAFGSYLGCGRYHHFLRGYFEAFPRERIRIYLFEDLLRDARALMADLYGFLGVEASFQPDTSRRMGRTGITKNPVARFVWTRSVALRTALRPLLPRSVRDRAAPIFMAKLEQPALDPDLRDELRGLFRSDIEQLQTLIGRDLTHWLQPAAREPRPPQSASA